MHKHVSTILDDSPVWAKRNCLRKSFFKIALHKYYYLASNLLYQHLQIQFLRYVCIAFTHLFENIIGSKSKNYYWVKLVQNRSQKSILKRSIQVFSIWKVLGSKVGSISIYGPDHGQVNFRYKWIIIDWTTINFLARIDLYMIRP